MAGKVQQLCAVVAAEYGNDAGRIWRDAASGREIRGTGSWRSPASAR